MARKRNEAVKAQDIVAALGGVTKEKSINMDLVLDSLKDALASAARKFLNSEARVEVDIDKENGSISVFTVKEVVDDLFDPDVEILLEDAKQIDPDLELGDEVVSELDINDFGRSAILTAKQIITQRVREHERQRILEDYSERVGELITGTVQQIDRGNVLINLGRTEALLPYKEQIRRERYRQGDTIRAAILEVKDNVKGPQVIVSRTSPEFLERLFEIEVPEIFEGIVKIVKIVRAPGYRAKVAVTTNDLRVDPVGACVGMRGNRVQAIVRELSNERMDIINWTDEFQLLVRRVFSPSDVKRIIPVGSEKIVVVVAEEDLAQAIGKEGQNIRLASKLLDREIDIYGEIEFEELSDSERMKIISAEKTTLEMPKMDDVDISDMPFAEDEFDGDSDEEFIIDDEEGEEEETTVSQEIVEEAVEKIAEDELKIENNN